MREGGKKGGREGEEGRQGGRGRGREAGERGEGGGGLGGRERLDAWIHEWKLGRKELCRRGRHDERDEAMQRVPRHGRRPLPLARLRTVSE